MLGWTSFSAAYTISKLYICLIDFESNATYKHSSHIMIKIN